MKEYISQVFELISAHIAAELILGTFGVWIVVKLWRPAMDYIRIRKWFSRAIKVGICDFFPSRESYAVDRKLAFADYIQSAHKSLRYFGHWLAFTIEQHHMLDTLCSMANTGKFVQLVLLDPDLPDDILSAYARYLGEDVATLRAEIQSTWQKVRNARSSLSAIGKNCLELRRHREFIPYSAFWFDKDHKKEHILIDMKLYGASRKDAYGIELHPVVQKTSRYPSLYNRYAVSLNKLENQSTVDAYNL